MIQAVRRIEKVERNGLLTLRVPELVGVEVDVIIIPRIIEDVSVEALGMMHLQEKSGFVSNVLADPVEDVWNDL